MFRVAVVILTLAYPFAVYFGLQQFGIAAVGLLLLLIGLLRRVTSDKSWLNHPAWFPLLCLLVLWAWYFDMPVGLKLYPVLVSASLLAIFAWSLRFPPSAIEKIARITEPNLALSGVVYTRKVTVVWCVFFALNGLIALYTALWGSDEVWALYNGIISYGLMGLLFAIEWLVRKGIRRRAHE